MTTIDPVSGFPVSGYPLSLGDIFKLGKTCFRVTELRNSSGKEYESLRPSVAELFY
jgi:hypothetical protein